MELGCGVDDMLPRLIEPTKDTLLFLLCVCVMVAQCSIDGGSVWEQ